MKKVSTSRKPKPPLPSSQRGATGGKPVVEKTSTLSWSSPIRRVNGRELSPIPNEIYQLILEYLRGNQDATESSIKRDLSNVALVCRFFSATVLPWIFESVTFDGAERDMEYERRDRYTPATATAFCRGVLQGSGTARAMALFIKRCTFRSCICDADAYSFSRELLAMYVDVLAYTPNVQEVSLKHTLITRGLLKALGRLPNLSTLTIIHNSRCAPDLKVKYLASLKLKNCRFEFVDHCGDEVFSAINLDTVLNLRMYNTSPSVWQTIHYSLLPVFSLGYSILPLEKLEISRLDESEFNAVLSRLPKLKSLSIQSGDFDVSKVKLAPNSLPLLSTIAAPLFISKFLIPGRPVSSISILCPNKTAAHPLINDINPSDIEAFHKSTRRITHLGLLLHTKNDFPFWKHFPDLRSLELRIDLKRGDVWTTTLPMEEFKRTTTDIWPKLPRIESLTLRLEGRNVIKPEHCSLEDQSRWIDQLSPHFPAMVRCIIRGYNDCQWDWSDSSHRWIPTKLALED